MIKGVAQGQRHSLVFCLGWGDNMVKLKNVQKEQETQDIGRNLKAR